MRLSDVRFRSISIAIALFSVPVLSTERVSGQIRLDNSSNTKLISIPAKKTTQITGGQLIQGNLFHSFKDFSIPQAHQAHFQLPANTAIANIFTRVTGKKISRIKGTLKTDGRANLILINPNGIQFSGSAQLDLGGGFLGTTAESIVFENGQVFSATRPQDTTLLKVKTPVGIQFGKSPSGIQVRRPINPKTAKPQLRLDPNQHFSLLGGTVQFLDRKVLIPNGIITLAGIGSGEQVALNLTNPSNLFNQFEGVTTFGDLDFRDAAEINTRFKQILPIGISQGRIQLYGKNLTAVDKVRIRSDVNESINIQLTDDLTLLDNTRFTTNTNTSLLSNFSPKSRDSLKTGNIDVQAKNVILRNGSQLKASAEGQSFGGQISLNLRNSLFISDISNQSRLSSAILSDGFKGGTGGLIQVAAPLIELQEGGLLRSQVFQQGNGGEIKLETDVLRLAGGSQISSTAVKPNFSGQAGTVNIQANRGIYLVGSRLLPVTQVKRETAIRTEALGTGRAGSLLLNTPILEVREGAQILNTTRGEAGSSVFNIRDRLLIQGSPDGASGIFSDSLDNGIAGAIEIDAPQIELNDVGLIRSQVFSNGQGGDINIKTHQLLLNQGSQISSSAIRQDAVGQPGSIDIAASDQVKLSRSTTLLNREQRQVSAIRAQTQGDAKAGDISLTTPLLTLEQGAQISNTSTGTVEGAGPSQINLRVNQLTLRGDETAILAETVGLSAAGNISLQSQVNQPLHIKFEGRPRISASSANLADGNSGSIDIGSSKRIALTGPGQIAAETNGSSRGGSIHLNSPQINIHRAQITSQSKQSEAGDIRVTGDNLLLSDRASLSTSSEQDTGGDIQLNLEELVLLSGGSEITATAAGNGGNITSLSTGRPWLIGFPSGARITADSRNQQGGNIDLNQFQVVGFAIAPVIGSRSGNFISASGRTPEQAGQIRADLVTNLLPNTLPQPPALMTSQLSSHCERTSELGQRSGFQSIGRGGIRVNPLQVNTGTFWDDTRLMNSVSGRIASNASGEIASSEGPVIEANGWGRAQNGTIVLRSPLSSRPSSLFAHQCHQISSPIG